LFSPFPFATLPGIIIMKDILIIGNTINAARQRLKKSVGDNVRSEDFYDIARLDDCQVIAMSGSPNNVCFLRDKGFDVEIITIGTISPAMQKRVNHVRSANG